MMDKERFERQKAFLLELDQEKNILRQTHLSRHGRRENDAEHAWHMAVAAYVLREYANEEIDIGRVLIMCLLHDVVEIDAGDTYAYDQAGKATEHDREEKAADRIFGLLPPDLAQELRGIFEEFEERKTPEAKFARVMDNLQPLMLNISNDGMDWKSRGIALTQVQERNARNSEGSKALAEEITNWLTEQADKGNLRNSQ